MIQCADGKYDSFFAGRGIGARVCWQWHLGCYPVSPDRLLGPCPCQSRLQRGMFILLAARFWQPVLWNAIDDSESLQVISAACVKIRFAWFQRARRCTASTCWRFGFKFDRLKGGLVKKHIMIPVYQLDAGPPPPKKKKLWHHGCRVTPAALLGVGRRNWPMEAGCLDPRSLRVCPEVGKYLLGIVFLIVGWRSIGTFTNPWPLPFSFLERSRNGRFHSHGATQNRWFTSWKIPWNWMIGGYPHFGKPPNVDSLRRIIWMNFRLMFEPCRASRHVITELTGHISGTLFLFGGNCFETPVKSWHQLNWSQLPFEFMWR